MPFKPLDYIKRYFTPSSPSPQSSDQSYAQWFLGALNAAQFGIASPENLSPIFTSVRIISETMAKIPCHLIQNTPEGKVYLTDEPLYKLIRFNPNNYQTAGASRGNLETLRLFNGNSYQLINREFGKPVNLELILPKHNSQNNNIPHMEGYTIMNGELFYTISRNGTLEQKSADDILHFKGAVSSDGIMGMNPMDAIQRNITMMDNNFRIMMAYAQNNILSTKWIRSSVPNNNKKAYDEAIENINKMNASPDQKGKVVHLPPNTELQNEPLSFVDMEMINTLKWCTQAVAAIMGIPSFLLGESEALRFNNMEQMMLSFQMNTIQFICNMYEDQYNMKLLTENQRKNGWHYEFDMSELVEVDYKTKMDGVKVLNGMSVLCGNQVADIYGFPHFEGGEKHLYASNNFSDVKDAKPINTEDPKTINPDLNN